MAISSHEYVPVTGIQKAEMLLLGLSFRDVAESANQVTKNESPAEALKTNRPGLTSSSTTG